MPAKVVAIVQARMGSTRLPDKVMKLINGMPMIELLLKRLSRAQQLDEIVVATSIKANNLPLIDYVTKLGYACEQGSENDVLERYYQVAMKYQAGIIVRITGDCPLLDPHLVDQAVLAFKEQGVDYLSNVSPASYPDGLDIEVLSFDVLAQAAMEANNAFDREHVTPYVRQSNKFSLGSLINDNDLSDLRWTVDEQSDFQVVTNVFNYFAPDIYFTWQQVYQLQQQQPHWFAANHQIQRNEGAAMGTGQKLWKRAKQIIPGGSMLLSKRAEMFLPEHWPAYFSQAKGCYVWDLDGNQYTDMSLMGVGTNTLGYGHPEVDEAVQEVIKKGNLSTFNAPEEVYLAERLIQMHPWAEMARFARTGGEACAIATRIARAATGKDGVAICGYHGWHDWYLSANLADDEGLDGHLLPGLEPNGVPKNLRGTIYPFQYNHFDEIEAIVKSGKVGTIYMEVSRNEGPKDNFLQKIRTLATQHGVVLIFDECTSGFRQTFGGLCQLWQVEPDLMLLSKTMGNGYAISAVIGRRDIMQAAQSSFISSTFWTERIGSVAALKTLEVMEREKSWQQITATGNHIRKSWQALADKYEISISHWGLPALAGFSFASDNALKYKTFITQEMLKKGYLAGNSCYASLAHTPAIVDGYFEALEPIFAVIQECEHGRDINSLLDGPVCHAGFKRLN